MKKEKRKENKCELQISKRGKKQKEMFIIIKKNKLIEIETFYFYVKKHLGLKVKHTDTNQDTIQCKATMKTMH